MLALHTHGRVTDRLPAFPLKVLRLKEALDEKYPFDRLCLLLDRADEDRSVDLGALARLGLGATLMPDIDTVETPATPTLHSLTNPNVVAEGDVIRVATNGQVRVLYRRAASSNALFVTERCNSRCLMCSQPPRDDDDSWRVAELERLIPLIDPSIPFLGFTGGEPTLLGEGLSRLIDLCARHLPETRLHVLTNGRNFEDGSLCDRMSSAIGRTTWAIPLYADVASRHDFVVQAAGALDSTINGIYNLAERGHEIEIRFVAHAQTLPRLRQYAEFLFRNMPFVNHVALMGMEPMGYAKLNRELLWVDPADYVDDLADAAMYLRDRGMNVSIYNLPLCILPRAVWSLARRSISDWKQTYGPECNGCSAMGDCSGFFASTGPNWKSRNIKPLHEEVVV
jgi:His-Xaa-Ser system radical SAM maturase HxsC